MKRFGLRRLALMVLPTLWLGACSHAPSARDIAPGAGFTTKILPDSTKLFTYSQRFMRGGGDVSTIDRPQAMRERDGMRETMTKVAQKGLEAMLAQNGYCRASYMVLEQYEEHGSYIIRGECRDSATDSDRERFVQ